MHRDYDGRDIVLPGDTAQVIRVADEPELAACKGLTIITTDGTTLLGADDKAGVAVILEALWQIKEHPKRLHGPIRIGFTPDEEVGRGTEHFDVKAFAAEFAYTIDGSGLGSLEAETFCADTAIVTVAGTDVHPGYAKNKMVNAVRVIARSAAGPAPAPHARDDRGPREFPASHLGHGQYVRGPELVAGQGVLRRGPPRAGGRPARHRDVHGERVIPARRVKVEIKPSYRNMKYKLDEVPHVVEYADEAVRRAGVTPNRPPVRGGTDGSRLSFMGLPDAQHLQRFDELPREEGVGAARVDGKIRRDGGQPARDLG